MFSALLYLQYRSTTNRLRERLRRLRQPRYFFGALVGGLYLALMFARPLLRFFANGTGPANQRTTILPDIPLEVWEFLSAFALLALVVIAWVVPRERAALVFTEAEIAFLFPAPIRRQTLIHYKLLRSQIGVLFTVFFLTLLTRWSGGLGGAFMRAAGWWIVLSTIQLHLLGASFARTLLVERGFTPWRRRAWLLLILATVALGAVWWARREVSAPLPGDALSVEAFAGYLQKVGRSAPAHWLLLPFRLVVRPFLLSGDPRAFWWAAGPALGLMALHYLWVARADVAFEEASIAASQRHAARVAAMRSGNWQNARPARKRRAPFRLAPTGPPAVAILWKNLLGAGQFFNARLGIVIVVWAAIAGAAINAGGGRTAWPAVIGWTCLMLLGWSLVLGPQVVRQDFRRDLAVADLLKIYPMRGWQLALGELLAPAVILTVIQWVLIVLAVTLLGHGSLADAAGDLANARDRPAGPWRGPFALGVAAAVIIPGFTFVSLLVPNAAALLLPAWFAGGSGQIGGAGANARGIEVIGQRLLFMLAQLFILALAILPVAVVFVAAYLLESFHVLNETAMLPVSTLAAALVFAAEAAGGLAVLGHLFESYDLSAERN